MEYFIGQILLLPYGQRPLRGMMKCEGQILSISKNEALFSLIGHRYGGDGVSDFGIPNLTRKAPMPEMTYYIVTEGIYPQFA